ncbi:MAG: hypothetical protein RL662_1910 [Bacteroidota bacterium]|jgi:ElaA protein
MSRSLTWLVDDYNQLDVPKLYNILHLRVNVFVVEQDVAYLDIDNKDQKAVHVQAYLDNELVAYCRLFKAGDYFDQASIGRVVVATKHRTSGYGHQLMHQAISLQESMFNETSITISAQLYLKQFYESHGFNQTSETYLEDGIPHIEMKYNKLSK